MAIAFEAGSPTFEICDFRFAIFDCRKQSIENRKLKIANPPHGDAIVRESHPLTLLMPLKTCGTSNAFVIKLADSIVRPNAVEVNANVLSTVSFTIHLTINAINVTNSPTIVILRLFD